jgi:hypothetical protein
MIRSVSVFLAGGLVLAGCSSMPSLDILQGAASTTTVQIESEPPGAEARTSAGQACRTPCALAVPATDFTVTFALNGYQSQTIPVRFAAPDTRIDSDLGEAPPPVVDPNPVYAELQPVAPTRRPPRTQRPPRSQSSAAAPPRAPAARPAPPPAAAVPAPAPAAVDPASPWPPTPR